MRKWKIAWTQRISDSISVTHVSKYEAVNAALAITQWSRMCYCNANIDAVWDAEQLWPPTYKVSPADDGRESPAGGEQSQVPRNGEAEAGANAVGRESVAQGGDALEYCH